MQQTRNTVKTGLAFGIFPEPEQLIGHLQNAFALDACAQQHRQKFCVTQRTGSTGQQFFTRLGLGRQVFKRHGVAE